MQVNLLPPGSLSAVENNRTVSFEAQIIQGAASRMNKPCAISGTPGMAGHANKPASEIAASAIHLSPHYLQHTSNIHEEFFCGLTANARSLGFEHCAYLVGIPISEQNWQFVMASNYLEAWRDRYRQHGYFAIDPVIQHARASTLSLAWSPALYELIEDLSADIQHAGFSHGWIKPTHEPSGKFGALILARSETAITDEELEAKLPLLHWLAHVAHTMLFRTLLAKYQNETAIQLTEREIELLRMAAEGKTAGDISVALGVTERTANYHMSNAMEKLGAANKTRAVAMAIRLGLLD